MFLVVFVGPVVHFAPIVPVALVIPVALVVPVVLVVFVVPADPVVLFVPVDSVVPVVGGEGLCLRKSGYFCNRIYFFTRVGSLFTNPREKRPFQKVSDS